MDEDPSGYLKFLVWLSGVSDIGGPLKLPVLKPSKAGNIGHIKGLSFLEPPSVKSTHLQTYDKNVLTGVDYKTPVNVLRARRLALMVGNPVNLDNYGRVHRPLRVPPVTYKEKFIQSAYNNYHVSQTTNWVESFTVANNTVMKTGWLSYAITRKKPTVYLSRLIGRLKIASWPHVPPVNEMLPCSMRLIILVDKKPGVLFMAQNELFEPAQWQLGADALLNSSNKFRFDVLFDWTTLISRGVYDAECLVNKSIDIPLNIITPYDSAGCPTTNDLIFVVVRSHVNFLGVPIIEPYVVCQFNLIYYD